MKALVFAHFSTESGFDSASFRVLRCINSLFDKVLIVSTSYLENECISDIENAEIINRPNIGYDFYSYRVGLTRLIEIGFDGRGAVVLANSSFHITNERRFFSSMHHLITLVNQYDLAGFVASRQFTPHLQSFLLGFSLECNSDEKCIFDFFNGIQPQNTKMELIQKYEVGLGELCQRNKLNVAALSGAGIEYGQTDRKAASWHISIVSANRKSDKSINEVFGSNTNPSLNEAERISLAVGIVKKEVLRSNPAKISLDFLHYCEKEIIASSPNYTHADRDRYKLHESGVYHYQTAGITKAVVGPYWGPIKCVTQVAVLAHVFYVDLLPEILELTRNIVVPFDLIVTTPREGDIPYILEILRDTGGAKTVVLTENRGRDIGPFVDCYRNGLLDKYQAVLKLHTKKSKYSKEGSNWRTSLYNELCGKSDSVLRIIDRLKHRGAGMIGPHEYFLTNVRFWGSNQATATNILGKCCGESNIVDIQLGFFGGSMFWFNPRAFYGLNELDEKDVDFPDENGAVDGTLAHAFERVFCQLAAATGYTVESNRFIGTSIYEFDNSDNGVPVL